MKGFLLIILPVLCFEVAKASERVFSLPEFPVEGRVDDERRELAESLGFQAPREAMIALPMSEGLDSLIGVGMQRRGLHALEPVIRGHGGDRVVTRYNGLLLPNASPTGTASPVNFFNMTGVHGVDVERSLSSVTRGASGGGGLIYLQPEPVWTQGGSLVASTNSIMRGISLGGSLHHGDPGRSLQAGFTFAENGDYTSGGDAERVDADYRGWMFSLTGRQTIDTNQSLTWATHYARTDLARNSSLPLDTVDSSMWLISLQHALDLRDLRLTLRAGYARFNPYLTSKDRDIPEGSPVLLVEADSPARSASFGWMLSADDGLGLQLNAGLDLDWQSRDATRRRHLADGSVFRDRIWPDVEQWKPGVFIEVNNPDKSPVRWRTGARIERTDSAARATDAPVEGIPGSLGSTILENFVAFNGPAARSTHREDWTGSLNGLLEFPLGRGLSIAGGIGYSRLSPALGDSYRAFVPALGGGTELGNPALQPEERRELSLRLMGENARWQFMAEGFLVDYNHYIQRAVVRAEPLVYSYRNTDARFHGLECGVSLLLLEGHGFSLSLPISFSRTIGKDTERGIELGDIPPWEGIAGLEFSFDTRMGRLSVRGDVRFVGPADNPDPDLYPIFKDTSGFTFYSIHILLMRLNQVRIGIQVDNLTDVKAYPYLQPPVAAGLFAPSSGTLSPGDSIPFPGRNVRVYLEFPF